MSSKGLRSILQYVNIALSFLIIKTYVKISHLNSTRNDCDPYIITNKVCFRKTTVTYIELISLMDGEASLVSNNPLINVLCSLGLSSETFISQKAMIFKTQCINAAYISSNISKTIFSKSLKILAAPLFFYHGLLLLFNPKCFSSFLHRGLSKS